MVNKKLKINYWSIGATVIGVIALVAVLGTAVAVKADVGGFWDNVADKVAAILSGRVENPAPSGDMNFGGSTSADWNVGGDLNVDGSSVLNGLTSTVTVGTFADATTTLACVLNPYSATSSVDFGKLSITGAPTSTIAIYVGTATTNTGLTTTTVAANLMSAAVAANTTGVVFNGFNSALTGVYAGGTTNRYVVGKSEYLCVVAGEGTGGITSSITSAVNTFAGTYNFRWVK